MAETTKPVGAPPRNPNPSAARGEREQEFRNLIESLPDAVLVHSAERIVFVNPFCLRLLGATEPGQLLGKHISEIIQADDLPAIENRIQNCYSTGRTSAPMEQTLIDCNGSPVRIEAVAIPISWNGAPAIEVVLRDISKRKQAEESAYESQQRLELAQKAGLRIGLWDWDISGNTVVWSDETYRQFGYTRGTFTRRVEDAVTRIHPEDRASVEHAIREVLDGKGSSYAEQYRIVRPDGSMCWIDAHGVMVRNGPPHMIGIGVDVSDLKNAEQALRESEERYLLLLNSTAEAIYGLDLSGKCTFCNPACARLLGYQSPHNLLGKNMHVLMHHTNSDGTPYPEEGCEINVAVREGRPSHVTHEVLWRADGTSFPAEYWSYPMYKGDQLVGAVVTFFDISDRKRAEQALRRSEQKYRNLFENATYGFFLSKPDGTLLDVNPALVNMLGYASKEELLAKNLKADIYQDPAVRKAILDRYGPSGRVDGTEANWKRKDGKIITVRINGGEVCGDNGSVSHYEVIVEDITQRRHLEAQFHQAQKMEAVGLLAGGISHDFNNLLSVILGNAELLLETAHSGVPRHYADEIKKASMRAAQLTRQLLAFSRKQVLYPTILNLNTVVNDVSKILRRLIGEDVQIVIEPNLRLGSMRADCGQIEQILMNLATNARDAMPNGGKFTIRTENAELGPEHVARYPYVKPGRYIHLCVSDTGVGMSEAVRARVFEPFFTTKPLGRGTGLGLATVYGIVKQSGGYIWISSELGVGTTFDIYLPRVDKKAPLPIPDSQRVDGYPKGTETVFVLEDDDSLRELNREILTGSGYNVLQAGRGDAAIDIADQYKGPIPLIVSDVVLPDMSGPRIVAKLQNLHPEMKALFVSGYADAPITQALVAGGAVLLQKPVSCTDLLRKVDELLHPRTRPTPS